MKNGIYLREKCGTLSKCWGREEDGSDGDDGW